MSKVLDVVLNSNNLFLDLVLESVLKFNCWSFCWQKSFKSYYFFILLIFLVTSFTVIFVEWMDRLEIIFCLNQAVDGLNLELLG